METPRCTVWKIPILLLALIAAVSVARADRMDSYQIGAHGRANVTYPDWFKNSFLDLRDNLTEAKKENKRGLIVFLSQKSCNHCQAFLDTTFSDGPTRARVQKLYDVIGLDIFSDLEMTDIDGTAMPVKDFAEIRKARLTPTLLFYGVENRLLLKIVGFYPPERFARVLDYIDAGAFDQEPLSQYLKRANVSSKSTAQVLPVDEKLFSKPPYALSRTQGKSTRPLLVIFEQPDCVPCARFHQRVLEDKEVRDLLPSFEAVRLDTSDKKTPVTTPDGKQKTPAQWADDLQLAYDIAVVFFDENGKEVHRLDAETGRDRMSGSMQYVLDKAYLKHEQFLRWRRESGAN